MSSLQRQLLPGSRKCIDASLRRWFAALTGGFVALAMLFMAPAAVAQAEHGIMVRKAVIYLAPDATSEKLGEIERGREVAVLEKASSQWLRVLASLTRQRDITGWMLDKGVVRKTTPNGDQIVFGEAVDSEAEASRRGGRKGAAEDAFRLYFRVSEYFPNSAMAGEAMYRAADIRWQLDKEDVRRLPSAKQRDPALRAQIDEEAMRMVAKKYPHTKWADLAAYNLIDNKLCGDWEARAKCPEKEADIYEKYAADHPQSPKAPEALYEAARRQAALVELYKMENQTGKSAEAKNRATALAQRIISQFGQSDWALRARRLGYMLEQNIPTYGNAVD
jgi:hypothetical protein